MLDVDYQLQYVFVNSYVFVAVSHSAKLFRNLYLQSFFPEMTKNTGMRVHVLESVCLVCVTYAFMLYKRGDRYFLSICNNGYNKHLLDNLLQLRVLSNFLYECAFYKSKVYI